MIDLKIIEDAVYDLCVEANTVLPENILTKLSEAYSTEKNADAKMALGLILQNAAMACEKKMPLCQDTGQVLVFVKGKCIPPEIEKIVNSAVAKAYEENFFRKSIVKNAVFDRTNTKTNTPCVIYTDVANQDELEIDVLIKGAGCENVGGLQMLSPTASEDEIIEYIVSVIKKAGSRGCPPYFLGVGIGGTMEYAAMLSKKALLLKENVDERHENFAKKIQDAVNKLGIGAAGLGGASTALDVKILTDFTHIACMPVAVTVNCHSSRHAKCVIKETSEIKRQNCQYAETKKGIMPDFSQFVSINTSDINSIKTLKQGQKVLLSGEIYTARDAAHKRLTEMIQKGEKLPFDFKDKIIFYAGPCPCEEPCVVGSIGPTTSSRMDKYTPLFYEKGVLGTIGKGERSEEVKKAIKENKGVYFTAIGGIACLLSEKFIKKELIAFEDLGTEAVCKYEIKDLPLIVNIGN